jgi:hypothetical protein
MALIDPQAVTLGSVLSLPNVGRGMNTAVYQLADSTVKLEVSHSVMKARTRRTVRITQSKVANNPLVSGQSVPASQWTYIVQDTPNGGYFTNAEQITLLTAISTWLSANTNANATKFVGGES